MASPSERVRALYADLEAGHSGDALRPHFTDDARTLEHPNLLKPRGARSDLAAMLAGSQVGASLLAQQRYEVRELQAQGDHVTVRLVWTGTLARDAGPLRTGQTLRAHIAQFITTRDGRIAEIETFDCYEPFSP